MKSLLALFFIFATVLSPLKTQATVRDQGDEGFCWAYAIANHLEENSAREKKTIRYSAEYLAYSRMAESLFHTLDKFEILALAKNSDDRRITGAIDLIREARADVLVDLDQGYSIERGFEMLGEVGIVPDDIFIEPIRSFLFVKPTFDSLVREFAKETLLNYRTLIKLKDNYSLFKQTFFAALGANPLNENTPFEYEGKIYTPLTFFKANFSPNLDDVETLSTYKPSMLDPAIRTVKKLLKRGHTVPVSFPVLAGLFLVEKYGVWSVDACLERDCGQPIGGHAALIVGMNKKGFIIENSWGYRGLTREGTPSTGLDSGYDLLTYEYLRQAIAAAPDLVSFTAMPDDKISLSKLFYKAAY